MTLCDNSSASCQNVKKGCVPRRGQGRKSPRTYRNHRPRRLPNWWTSRGAHRHPRFPRNCSGPWWPLCSSFPSFLLNIRKIMSPEIVRETRISRECKSMPHGARKVWLCGRECGTFRSKNSPAAASPRREAARARFSPVYAPADMIACFAPTISPIYLHPVVHTSRFHEVSCSVSKSGDFDQFRDGHGACACPRSEQLRPRRLIGREAFRRNKWN